MSSSPAWLNTVFAGLMLAVAGYSAARVLTARALGRVTHYDIDGAHVPMGLAMAAMFAPRLNFLPWWLWGAIFAALTCYFLARTGIAARRGTIWADHYLPHTVHSGAMLYMILAVPAILSGSGTSDAATSMAGMGAGGGLRLPTIALVLALFMAGYTVVLTSALPDTGSPAGPGAALAPRGCLLYKIVMSVGMGFMLVLML